MRHAACVFDSRQCPLPSFPSPVFGSTDVRRSHTRSTRWTPTSVPRRTRARHRLLPRGDSADVHHVPAHQEHRDHRVRHAGRAGGRQRSQDRQLHRQAQAFASACPTRRRCATARNPAEVQGLRKLYATWLDSLVKLHARAQRERIGVQGACRSSLRRVQRADQEHPRPHRRAAACDGQASAEEGAAEVLKLHGHDRKRQAGRSPRPACDPPCHKAPS